LSQQDGGESEVPIYEYQCKKCSEVFEAFQKINDNPLKECKFCGGKVDKLISTSSFQLKGSGWYLTDYSRKSGNPASPSESSKPAEKTEKTDKPKESAPAKSS
jgi:putative FmdB family regulatory protein